MKRSLGSIYLFSSLISFANIKDSTIYYSLPDSVKAISFMAEITVNDYVKKKYCAVGIKTDALILSLEKYQVVSVISLQSVVPPKNYLINGFNVHPDKKFPYPKFSYDWQAGETYRLLISQATDSVGNFSLYSGYVFLPKENKWKLIGTVKIDGRWNTIQQPAFFYKNGKKQNLSATKGQVWCQRQNGSWKNMLQNNFASPIVNLYSHIDSLNQLDWEKYYIDLYTHKSIRTFLDTLTPYKEHAGVYYKMLKEGTGKQVSVNDTVVAFYKGYLFSDNSVFDQTKDKSATFPLARLIRGWQIGVPLCKVGGKIRIIIPSNLAYSIRTRAAKIPPNSILVFEIEVVDAKSPID